MYTKEPWPKYDPDQTLKVSTNPNAPVVVLLSPEDYIRAIACVNACAGIPTETLEAGTKYEKSNSNPGL